MTSPPEAAAGTLRASLPLVAAGFVISFMLIGGGIDTVGVFINAITEANGWPRTGLSLGVAVGAAVAALSTPGVGIAVDRYGVRVPMLWGVGLLATGFAIVVVMQAPWHFVVANVFLGMGFAGCALLPLTIAITLRVRDRTALALGIAGTGASAGALALAPAAHAAIEALGWRGTYMVMGTLLVLTPLPCLAFALPRGRLERHTEAERPKPALPSLRELGRPGLRGLLALMVLPGLATFAISVHLVPYLTDSGFSGATAAFALGATIGVSAVGKIAGGWLADRFGTLPIMRTALFLGALSLTLLPAAATSAYLAGFVALYGIALGTYAAVIPALAMETLGGDRFGTLFGLLQLVAMLAAAAGPVTAGVLFDATGHYDEAMGIWIAALSAALLVALVMRPRSRAARLGAEA
ncbi:MAG: MFS transporter [Deltaproteobacteria bacterium]|nr:MFS transporter [Deltaproteobacteria bacterium]